MNGFTQKRALWTFIRKIYITGLTEPYALLIDSLTEPTHLLYIERYIHYFIAEVQ